MKRRTGCRVLAVTVLAMLFLQGCKADSFPPEPDVMFDQTGYHEMDVDVCMELTEVGSVDVSFHLERDGAVSHIADMAMTITDEGSEPLQSDSEIWFDNVNTWTNVISGGQETGWLVQDVKDFAPEYIANLFASVYPEEQAVVEDEGKVSWPVTFEEIAVALDGIMAGISEVAAYADMGNLTAVAEWEKETSQLLSFSVKSDETGADGSIEMTFTNIVTGDSVGMAVPDDVKADAVSYDSIMNQQAPKKGAWNEPRSDGYIADVTWMDDGKDEQIDNIVKSIQAGDIGFNILEVSHENEMAILYNSGSEDDWTATMNIYQYESQDAAMAAMQEQYQTVDPVYGPAYESIGDGDVPVWVVYVSEPNENIGAYVLIMGVQGDMMMTCGGFDWTGGSKEDAKAYLMQMVDVTGLDWGRTE